MYKVYNWTCNTCHSAQEVFKRCTVAEHLMECDGQTSPILQCGKCKAQTQAHTPSIDPALLAMSDGSVNSPRLTSPGSGASSPLVERSGRYLRQRLATPCRRQVVRHHPYQYPTSVPAGQRNRKRKEVLSPSERLPQCAAPRPQRPPPAPPAAAAAAAAKSSFTTEISSNSSASPPPPPPPRAPVPHVNVHANAHEHAHARPAQSNIVNRMHVNRTKIFKTAARDLSEAKAKLGDQAPQRVCNAWEVAWDQLKKDMGIIF